MLIEAAYAAYSGQLLRSMLRFSRDEEAARDAVSHAFTQALSRRGTLEAMPDAAMRAWIFAAARNSLVDAKRREKRLLPMEEPPEEPDPAPDPTDRILIFSMLDRLPPELSEPVRLRYYQGFNSTEIGRLLNLPPATVRTRLRTALLRMRSMLDGNPPAPSQK